MPLLRPSIPVEVCCRVALRQLGEMWPDQVITENHRKHGALLSRLLDRLVALLDCPLKDLRLDHHPALENREKVFDRHGNHIGYIPDANDPVYLMYREKHAHHIKTNVRGDGAQFADNVIAKRERKRLKKAASVSRAKVRHPKGKWSKGRKLQSRNNLRRKP